MKKYRIRATIFIILMVLYAIVIFKVENSAIVGFLCITIGVLIGNLVIMKFPYKIK